MPLFPGGSSELEPRVARLEDNYQFIQSLVSGWAGTGSEPYFNDLRARHAKFEFNPEGFWQLVSTTDQSIPDDVATAVQFDRLNSMGEPPATWSSNVSSAITLVGRPREHGFLIGGIVEFNPNTSGRRTATFSRWFGGSSRGGNTMFSLSAPSTHFSVSFMFPWRVGVSPATGEPESETHLLVRQDSGGALNLTYATFYITRVY